MSESNIDQDAPTPTDTDIQQTREQISETLDAIQAKLAPERLTDEARDTAIETADHVLHEARVTAQELSELASVAAMEAVEHALKKVREALPELQEQAHVTAREASEAASSAAKDAVDHAIDEAKVAVRELGEQARAAVRDATIGRVERMATTTTDTSRSIGSSVIQRVRQNPGPAAVAALGIGWLAMGGSQGQKTQDTQTSDSQDSSSLGDQVQERVGQAQDGIETASDQVQHAATEVANQAQNLVTGAAGAAQATVGAVANQATSSVSQLAEQAQQMPGRLRQRVETKPMTLGLVALGLGAAAAMATPETQRENDLMGEARDSLMGRAQSAVETVQRVAGEVGETMQKETTNQS